MKKKYLKILIVVVLFCILITVFSQIGVKPLSLVQKGPKTLSEKYIKVSLFVQEERYDVEIKEGSTFFELMKKIKEENNKFDFKYKEYTGLGIFINEINGLKEGSGGYWIYSVNGKEANIGVSNYKIKNGDIISWKYEK